MERLAAAQPALVALVALPVLLATLWNAARAFGPDYFYARGFAAFEKQRYLEALPDFDRAMRLGGGSARAAEAAFFRAASLFRLERFPEALAAYRRVIERHPDSIWVAESHYHVGLALVRLGHANAARQAFEQLVAEFPESRWAGLAGERLLELKEPRG
jgi:TolA-binding protein